MSFLDSLLGAKCFIINGECMFPFIATITYYSIPIVLIIIAFLLLFRYSSKTNSGKKELSKFEKDYIEDTETLNKINLSKTNNTSEIGK